MNDICIELPELEAAVVDADNPIKVITKTLIPLYTVFSNFKHGRMVQMR